VIERHAVSGTQAAGDVDFDSRADEVIRVPVMEEQVTVQKRPVVTEEVSLGKRQVTETQHVTDTVRHEEVRIDNPGNVDIRQRGDAALDSELDEDDLDSDVAVNRTNSQAR
jgi:stress response protein YsnF